MVTADSLGVEEEPLLAGVLEELLVGAFVEEARALGLLVGVDAVFLGGTVRG